MKQSIVGGLVFGLLVATMIMAGAAAVSTDTVQSSEAVADKDKLRPTSSVRKAGGSDAPGSDRMFNLQAELPERKLKAVGRDAPGSDRMFNPQPELPERKADGSAVKAVKPGSDRTFNPQPQLPEKSAPAAKSD